MESSQALAVLGLSSAFSLDDLEQVYQRKQQALKERLAGAPDALKDKFYQNIEQLDVAHQWLLKHHHSGAGNTLTTEQSADYRDLPIAAKHIDSSPQHSVHAALQGYFTELAEAPASQGFECFKARSVARQCATQLRLKAQPVAKPAQAKIERQLAVLNGLKHQSLVGLEEYAVSDQGVWLAMEPSRESKPLLESAALNSPAAMLVFMRSLSDLLSFLALDKGHGNLSADTVTVLTDGRPLVDHIFIDGLYDRAAMGNQLLPPELKRTAIGSERADQYMLAVMALEWLLGRRIAAAGLPAALADKSLTDKQRSCFKKALHDNPSQRYYSCHGFCDALAESLVTAADKWLKNPVAIACYATVVVLLILSMVFKHQLFSFYQEHKPDTASNVIDYPVVAIKTLAESKDLVAQLTATSADLKREVDLASSQLKRLKRSSKYRSSDISQAQAQADLLAAQNKVYSELLLTKNDFRDMKSSLVVAEQYVTAKEHVKAVEIAIPIHSRLKKIAAVSENLASFVSVQLDNRKLREQLTQLKRYAAMSAAFLSAEQRLLKQQSELIAANDYPLLWANVYRPLNDLYAEELVKAKASKAAAAAELQRAFADKIASQMIAIPAGSFKMGVVKAGAIDARPVHRVSLKAFTASKYPITNGLYNEFLNRSGKSEQVLRGYDNYPVVNVSWQEAVEFTQWLSRLMAKSYRLPTESEWEYMARGNIRSLYNWGNSVGHNNANCSGCGSQWDDSSSSPVGSFDANQFGLYDINGNVWEWVQDCYAVNYHYAPNNGQAVESAACKQRVARGGGWNTASKKLHPSLRSAAQPATKIDSLGFRVVSGG